MVLREWVIFISIISVKLSYVCVIIHTFDLVELAEVGGVHRLVTEHTVYIQTYIYIFIKARMFYLKMHMYISNSRPLFIID